MTDNNAFTKEEGQRSALENITELNGEIQALEQKADCLKESASNFKKGASEFWNMAKLGGLCAFAALMVDRTTDNEWLRGTEGNAPYTRIQQMENGVLAVTAMMLLASGGYIFGCGCQNVRRGLVKNKQDKLREEIHYLEQGSRYM